MKYSKHVFNIVMGAVLFVALCGADSCNSSKTTEITILHTNDMHSHMRAQPSNSEKNPFNLGGFAKLKTLVDKLRATKKNTLLLDAGDWSESSTYFNVDAGTNILKIMDAIGYDATVAGNHDFLNGPTELASTIERAAPRFPVLGANKNLSNVPDKERLARLLPDYKIFDVDGVKVAVVGLLCNDFFYYEFFKPAVVTNAFEAASAITKKLHNEKLADVIVLLSHNSFSQNVTWAKTIPWVNVVVSGHTHFKTSNAVETTNGGNPAYVVEAKQWGQFLGEVTLTVDKEAGKVTLKNSELHPVSADLAEDPKIAALIDESDKILAAKYGKDIVHDHAVDCTDEMTQDDGREGVLGNLAADAYRTATGADLGMESVQLIGTGVQAGPLSTLDLMNITPHTYKPIPGRGFPQEGRTWTLKKLTVSGTSLRGLLNLTFVVEGLHLVGWISLSGAQVTYTSNGLSSVKSVKILNPITGAYEDLVDTREYTIALHDGLLLAMGILVEKLSLNVDLKRIQETAIEAWTATIAQATSKGALRASDYEPGTRYRPLTADLAFYEHSVHVRPRTAGPGFVVNVAIQNEGLTASEAGSFKLSVLRSKADDLTHDATAGNESTPISPDVNVPALNPGDRTIIEVPWNDLPTPGIYSLRLKMSGSDANAANNSVLLHTRIPATR